MGLHGRCQQYYTSTSQWDRPPSHEPGAGSVYGGTTGTRAQSSAAPAPISIWYLR
jgi:hypothetical protein